MVLSSHIRAVSSLYNLIISHLSLYQACNLIKKNWIKMAKGGWEDVEETSGNGERGKMKFRSEKN